MLKIMRKVSTVIITSKLGKVNIGDTGY